MSQPRTTDRATALVLDGAWNAADTDLAARLHPLYGPAVRRAPAGSVASRGLPFRLGDPTAGRRWLAVEGPVRVDLGGTRASHLVLLAFCDAWREPSGERPVGAPIGWVLPVGEALARVTVELERGPAREVVLRRRFEVNEGIIGWGAMAFLAVPHLAEAPVDWRGPHPRLPEGRYAEPGHTGAMTVLPGSWAVGQTGVEDHVPSPTDDLMLWLHAIEVGTADRPAVLSSMRLEPIAGPGEGRLVVVAAVTTFLGEASPLRWLPRRSLRLDGAGGLPVAVDMGIVARRAPLPEVPAEGGIRGWGVQASGPARAEEVEVTAAEDAVLHLGDVTVPLREVAEGSPARTGGEASDAHGIVIRALPSPDRRLAVEVTDADGRPVPSRVRFAARDGRYLPPLGHRREVNVGLDEDLGADLFIGGVEYAYVDGRFDIELPADGAIVEVVRGPRHAPLVAEVERADLERGSIRLACGEAVGPMGGRWVSGDTHVHFLSPSTALLQARAEGVNVVHLLATQWGDHHTSITDIGGDQVHPGGEHAVWVGSENRQNMLGHIGLVGARRPYLPFASGGPPEGPIGGAVALLMADWLRRCREDGGLAIGAHFPLPMAEVAADIAAGLLDALEFETLDLALENPGIREWYRFLCAGYRLPVVGGTDKMTATVPLGQIRTWARLDDGAALSFEAWASAVRAGRTFVTSGPLIELSVEGHEPGQTVEVPAGARLEVEVVARAAQPVISDVELVGDGRVVAAESVAEPRTELRLRERLVVERTGWLAGRSRSPYAVGSAFATAMAAHTSPVYLEVPGRPRAPVDMGPPLSLVDGTRAWLENLAPLRDPRDLQRFRAFLDESERRLRERAGGPR